MSVFSADILASLSATPSDNRALAVRAADVPPIEGRHKGFSAVLRKVQDTERKDEPREADDMPSSPKTDDRSHAKDTGSVDNDVRSTGKDTRGRDTAGTETEQSGPVSQSAKRNEQAGETTRNDTAQTRAEQSDASSSQSGKSSEPDSSKDRPVKVSGTEVDVSGNEGVAHLSVDDQGQVPLFMASLIAPSSNTQPVDPRQRADRHNLQGAGEGAQTKDGSSESVSAIPEAATSSTIASQNGDGHAPQSSTTSATKGQQQLISNRSVTHAVPEASVGAASESRQSSTQDDTGLADKMVGQGSSDHVSTRDGASSGTKADGLELKDTKVAVEPIRKDHAIEGSKGDTDHKLKGLFLDHPLLSPAQGQSLGVQDRDDDAVKNMSLSQEGPQPVVEFAEDFREMWAGRHGGRQDQHDGKSLPVAASDQNPSNGQRAESLVSGSSGTLQANSTAAPALSQSMSHAQSTQPPHPGAPVPLSAMMRTVVLDVIQPDLGHVNVRVAMTNDVVHAYLSADRPEVGQSLISGQDRLQASLQANGLDMGQFRVDIDRQSAGRSFQQGFSQDQQSRAWTQGSSWMDGERTGETYESTHPAVQGLLNLVA